MIVLSISLPARLAAHPMQDLGSLLPPGSQVPPDQPQDSGLPQQPGLDPSLDAELVLIEDRFAGWQQAGTGQKVDRLDQQLRANWVMVDDNGLLAGRILVEPEALATPPNAAGEMDPRLAQYGAPPAGPVYFDTGPGCGSNGGWQSGMLGPNPRNVAYYRNPENPNADRTPMQVFLLNRGKLISMSEIDAEGQFVFRGVKSGMYSLVGYGRAGFFAYGLNVLPFAENADAPKEIVTQPIPVFGPPVTDWVTRAAPNVRFRVRGQHRFGEGRDDPPRLYGLQGLQTFLPAAAPATSIAAQPTALTEDGRLLGRIHYVMSYDGRPADLLTTTVQLTQNGQVVQQSSTDNYGVFEFQNVAPGTYGIQAVGPDGLAATAVTVVEQPGPGTAPVDLAMMDDTSIGFLNHFMRETAYWSALSPPSPPERDPLADGCYDLNLGGYGTGCPLLDMFHNY
jgi:hypothetical protein